MRYKTAGFKRAFVFIVVVCTAVAVSSVIYWRLVSRRLAQDTQETLVAASRDSAEDFNRLFGAQLQVLTALSVSLEDQPSLVVNQKALASYLNKQNRRNSFELTGVQRPDGRFLLSNGTAGRDFLAEAEVQAIYEHSHLITAPRYISSISGQAIILAVPVRGEGSVKGLVFAVQSVGFYEEALAAEPLSGKGLSFIVSQQGNVLVGYPSDTYPNVFKFAQGAVFDSGRTEEDFLEYFSLHRSGIVGYKYHGKHRFASYYPLGYNDWYALAVLPTTSVAEKAHALMWLSLATCLSVIGVLGLMLAFILRLRFQSNRALYNMGFVDPLTQADNLNAFQLKYPSAVAGFKEKNMPFALAVVNINRFKAVNDIYGFEQGDYILKQVAQALQAGVQEGELFCRTMADEFLLFLACPSHTVLGERIEELLHRAGRFCQAGGECMPLSLTCGLYRIEEDAPFFILMDRAHLALASAKLRAGHSYAFYEEEYLRQIVKENRIESSMDQSLQNEEFKIYLQPKCDFLTGRIKSAEALVRWVHPRRGLIPPDGFIPVFEKNGFVVKLDMFMLEHTLQFLKKCKEQNLPLVPIGVNFSRLHLENPLFIEELVEAADRYGVEHHLLEIELTESIIFTDADKMKQVIDGLHAQGFSVAMDDFGSAYSSLNVLKNLEFDCIKLDKEFLASGEGNPRMRQIISGVVKMIKGLESQIVAEGVETREQAEFLHHLGCDLAQGYFFYKPLPLEEFETLLAKQARRTLSK